MRQFVCHQPAGSFLAPAGGLCQSVEQALRFASVRGAQWHRDHTAHLSPEQAGDFVIFELTPDGQLVPVG